MEAEFPFERPFFDFHHRDRFPQDWDRWRWERDRRGPWGYEAEGEVHFPGTADWEQFKHCMKIQYGLDVEALKFMFQPLQDLWNWWSRQSAPTKTIVGRLFGPALTQWIARALGVTVSAFVGELVEYLGAVGLGIGLGTFMDMVGRCLYQISTSPQPGASAQEAESEAEFPFERPFFDFQHRDRFPQDWDRWRWERDRRGPWGYHWEGEVRPAAPEVRPAAPEVRPERPEVRPGRPLFRTTFDFHPPERFPLDRDRWRWDRDRRWDWRFGVPGDRPQILWAQSCLAQILGPWVVQDGHMGPNTSGALRTFQQQRGLPPTGVLDGDTVNALHAACGN